MAARKAKGLTRKITKKRALSYDRMAPNRRGVTALSEVNGPGAYDSRYERTRAMLAKDGKMAKANSWQGKLYRQQVKKGRSAAQARATVRMVEGMRAKERAQSKSSRRKPSGTKRATTKRRTKRSGTKPRARSAMKPNLRKGGATVRKGDYVAGQIAKGRSPKQAAADWKLASGFHKKAKVRRKKGRTYGKGKGAKRALRARAGTASKYTYLTKTKKGNTRKIPDYALLGFKSAQAMAQVFRTGTEAQRQRLGDKMLKLLERRERAAEKAKDKALRGTAWFSPNPEVLSFEEWNKMKPNARKKTTKKTTRKKRASTSRPRYGTKAYYRWLGKKGAAAKKRKARGGSTRKRAATKRSSTRKKSGSKKRVTRVRRDKLGRRITRKRVAASRRNIKKACRSAKVRRFKGNRKGAYKAKLTAAKRRVSKRSGTKRRRKGYKANARGAAYKTELMNAFKFGAIVTGGFLAHRVLTNLLDKQVLSRMPAAISGLGYRKTLAGLLAAAIGVPLTVRMLPKHAGVAAAGMTASVIYDLVLMGLQKVGSPALLEAVSNYPNAEGYPQYSGMGSYYEFSPHQVYGNGMGEYYETQYTPGLEQAAAGMGNAYGGGQMLTQAAAGLQQMYANPMGEYYAYGSEGIGEYESSPMMGGGGGYVDDGIQPNVHSAEQMLDVAEAAAGLGDNGQMLTQAAAGFGGDVPMQSTINPMIRAMDIPDTPGGSRAGILAGGDGIFG